MVWENGCVVIVMLTPLVEGGVKQCYHYWPDEGSNLYHVYEVTHPAGTGGSDGPAAVPDRALTFVSLQVNLVSEHIWCDDFLVRSFYLKNMQTNETRTVTQFHFLTWLNQNVPESSRTLLDFRRYGSLHHVWLSCWRLNVRSGLEKGGRAPRPRRRQSWNNVKVWVARGPAPSAHSFFWCS